jgi:excinuclease ABC subunit A
MRVAAASDWLIDMGPGAGDRGGRVVARGTPAQVVAGMRGATAVHLAPLLA